MSSNGVRVLIVDDEEQIRRFLRVALKSHDYEIAEASTGKDGLRESTTFHPDIILLDLGLPDMDGLSVLKELREWSKTPVIILSVREQENDKIEALDLGADDYVTKPFNMGELLARMRVAMRHNANYDEEPVITAGELSLDLAHRKVIIRAQEVKLTPTEYEILKNLAINLGKVLTHKYLLNQIWGKEYQKESHYLRVYVRSLRRKIELDPTQPKYLMTEPGVGYRLVVPTD
jgi:two-component system, OmpR family, KDP operon response regulator KdpE